MGQLERKGGHLEPHLHGAPPPPALRGMQASHGPVICFSSQSFPCPHEAPGAGQIPAKERGLAVLWMLSLPAVCHADADVKASFRHALVASEGKQQTGRSQDHSSTRGWWHKVLTVPEATAPRNNAQTQAARSAWSLPLLVCPGVSEPSTHPSPKLGRKNCVNPSL